MDERRQVLRELGDLGGAAATQKPNLPPLWTKPPHWLKRTKKPSPTSRKPNAYGHGSPKNRSHKPCLTITTPSKALALF